MDYDWKAIGKRIKQERLAAGIKSQSDFAEKLSLSEKSRQTIGKWENGKTLPSLVDFTFMCNIFKCELGYLLCEYDCKTREATDIQAVTGLSENAINLLSNLKVSGIQEVTETLSKLMEHEAFIDLLRAIHIHIWDFNKNRFRIDYEDIERVATVLNCKNGEVQNYMKASSKSLIESTIIKIVESLT